MALTCSASFTWRLIGKQTVEDCFLEIVSEYDNLQSVPGRRGSIQVSYAPGQNPAGTAFNVTWTTNPSAQVPDPTGIVFSNPAAPQTTHNNGNKITEANPGTTTLSFTMPATKTDGTMFEADTDYTITGTVTIT